MSTRPGRLGVGVIGAGRVGVVLANALRSAGHAVIGVSATSQASRERAEAMLPSVPILPVPQIVERAELVLVTVPDDALEPLVAGLAKLGAFHPGQLVVHTAGRYGVGVLEPARACGAIPLALHPAMTFTGTSMDLGRLVGAPFAVTADAPVLPIAQALVVEIGGEPIVLDEASRTLYHAALCHGGNHLVTLVSQAIRSLAAIGIPEGGQLLEPLVHAALDGAIRGGEIGLTGPVVRGDVGTVRGHVAALGQLAAEYPALADVPASYRQLATATTQRALVNGRINESQAAELLDTLAQAANPQPGESISADDGDHGLGHDASPANRGSSALPADAGQTGVRGAVIHTIDDLRRHRAGYGSETVAVVMTMGALHAGHLSLVEYAKKLADRVIVTIFVNPLQFGEGEDLDAYPRTLDADIEALAHLGVDLVFAPSPAQMYPDGPPRIWIRAGQMGSVLEGEQRPTHFDGMLTVVSKLLHITSPDIAVFGQKDAQQLALIRALVADQNMAVEIAAGPIVRESDGLAMSSRNAYLNPAERKKAVVLSAAMSAAAEAVAAGEDAGGARRAAAGVLARAGVDLARALGAEQIPPMGALEQELAVNPLTTDYLAVVDEATMEEVPDSRRSGEALMVIAVRVGTTRLLDNVKLKWPSRREGTAGEKR